MKTCLILPYYEQYLPASLVPSICQVYDVVSVIPNYSPGLNIISSSGSTRLLDALKTSPIYTPNLRPLKCLGNSRVLSPGQVIYEVGLELLNATEDGCLLCDEPLIVMKGNNQEDFLRAMLNSKKQVVMTVSNKEMSVVRGICSKDVNFIGLKK